MSSPSATSSSRRATSSSSSSTTRSDARGSRCSARLSCTATCEYLVELEDERATRELKDPRDFRILDPACGSGHFLLYSFDLLEQMYREAWEHSLRAAESADGIAT